MEDDELLFEINEFKKKSRTTFESIVNRKNFCAEELDDIFNEF